MEQKKYSGYYCNKCNYIPLIKIIPTNNEIKYIVLVNVKNNIQI